MMKVSLVIEAVNRATGPLRSIMAAVRGLTSTARAASAATAGIAGIGRAARGSALRVYDFTRDAGYHFRTLAGPQGIARASASLGYLRNQVSGLVGGLSILKFAAGAAIVGLGEEFVRGVFKAGGEMQGMLVTLTKLEGGANSARKAMEWMRGNFAFGAGNAFTFPDIMKSYQLAKEGGMNPQGGSLAAFADLAAAWRVPLGQVIFAVKDAMMGTSSRPLANLGIKMHRSKGGPVDFNYQSNDGGNVSLQSKSDQQSILATIERIIAAKYGGLASAQGNTVPGKLEQLKKMLYIFQTNVWSAGVGDWAMTRLNQFLAFLKRASGDGSWDKLAKKVSDFITGTGDKLFTFIMKTDWAGIGRDLKLLASSIVVVAGAIGMLARIGGGGLSGLFNVYIAFKVVGITRALLGLVPVMRAASIVIWGLGRAFLGLIVAGGPIVWAITAIAVAGLLVWRYWTPIKAFFLALPGRIVSAWQSVKTFFSTWQPPSWLRLFTSVGMLASGNVAGAIGAALPGTTLRQAAPRAMPTSQARAASDALARAAASGKSEVTIRFDNAPAGMRVAGMKPAPGQTLNVKRGPIAVGAQ